jgi:hypothetical protein
MKKHVAVTVAVLAAIGLTFSLVAADLTLDKIPAKAREALQKLAGNNPILEVEAETEHGLKVYEAEWKANGTIHEAEVTENGELLEMEEGVKAEDVPEVVKAAAEKAMNGAAKLHYAKHTVVFYEVEGRVDGKGKEVSISPSGRLINGDEDEDGDDDDGEDDKDDDGK